MLWVILGLITGVIIGFLTKFSIPVEYVRYTAVAILAALDTVFGAWKAELDQKYDNLVFLSGLGFNMVVAAGIVYLGDRLALDLYLAVIFVFTFRIFLNIGTIRNKLLEKFRKRSK